MVKLRSNIIRSYTPKYLFHKVKREEELTAIQKYIEQNFTYAKVAKLRKEMGWVKDYSWTWKTGNPDKWSIEELVTFSSFIKRSWEFCRKKWGIANKHLAPLFKD